MPSKKPKPLCYRCYTKISRDTAKRNDGLCKPCKKAREEQIKREPPLEVSCEAFSYGTAPALFFACPEILLKALQKIRSTVRPHHANHYEIKAQKALLRHVIEYRNVGFRLHDDHWQRTSFAFCDLFEKEQAELECEGVRYRFADVVKSDWHAGGSEDEPWMGGFAYANKEGTKLFKRVTKI